MTFIILLFYFYKLFFPKKYKLIKRETLPKICVYINSSNYVEILKVFSLQTYPNSLFDVYINTDTKFNYKFNVYKYNHDLIRNNNYNLVTIITDIVDLNYLNFTAKEYLLGYDIIFGSSNYNISLLLVKRTINKIINNQIYDDCFSFNIELFNNNVLNFENILLLKKFLTKKTSLISFNSNIKTIGNNETYNAKILLNNPLDKRFFYFKIYLITLSLLIITLSGNLLLFCLIIYILLCISNIIFLYKNNNVKILSVILLPINLIKYFINYLLFRINNKRGDIKSIKTT